MFYRYCNIQRDYPWENTEPFGHRWAFIPPCPPPRAHGISNAGAEARVKKNIKGWKYADDNRIIPYTHRNCKPVWTPDGIYPSVTIAARAHGIIQSAASVRAKKHTDGWRYTDQGS